MRLGRWPLVTLVSAGCQLLPGQTVDCASSNRCAPVSFVLGQPDSGTNKNLQEGMAQPVDALVIGTKLFVAECQNNRILGWRTFPTTNQQPPDFVLGQADFSTNFANYGGVSARSLSCPQSLAYGVDQKLKKPHLIVGDRNNNRIVSDFFYGLVAAAYRTEGRRRKEISVGAELRRHAA